MSIKDYSDVLKSYEEDSFRNQNELAPQHPATLLISGSTGSGKTNFLLNLLTNPETKMSYDRVYLCCPSLDEPAYKWLRDFYEKVRKKQWKELKKQDPKFKFEDVPQIFYHISDPSQIPVPAMNADEDLEKKASRKKKAVGGKVDLESLQKSIGLANDGLQKLVIIDDFTGNKIANEKIEQLCQKNRKINTTLAVLNHDLYRLPPTLKRNLGNGYCVLFNCPNLRLLNQYAQDFGTDISKDEFKQLYNHATKDPYSFLTIDMKTKDPAKRYRKRIDETNLLEEVLHKKHKIPDNKLRDLLKELEGSES